MKGLFNDIVSTSVCVAAESSKVEGTEFNGLITELVFKWEPCSERAANDTAKPECMTAEEEQEWLIANQPKAFLVYSHNFVDF